MNKDVIAALAAQARADMVKEARGVGGFLKNMFGMGAKAAPKIPVPHAPMPMPKPPAAPGSFLRRSAAPAAIGLAGAGVAADAAINNRRDSWNPFRQDSAYSGDMSPEDAYRFHRGNFNQQAAPLNRSIEASIASGDTERADTLMNRMNSGDYSSSGLRPSLFRRLNPFGKAYTDAEQSNISLANQLDETQGFGIPTATRHQSMADAAAKKLQDEYTAQSAKTDPSALNKQLEAARARMQQTTNPVQRNLYEKQMAALQKKLSAPGGANPEAEAIAQRMRGAGIPMPSSTPQGGGGGGDAWGNTQGYLGNSSSGHWNMLGSRPQAPNGVQAGALNRFDNRSNASNAMLDRMLASEDSAGPLTR